MFAKPPAPGQGADRRRLILTLAAAVGTVGGIYGIGGGSILGPILVGRAAQRVGTPPTYSEEPLHNRSRL